MKKHGRLLSIIMAAAILFAMLPTGIIASAEIVNSGECGDDLTWELDSDGNLTITGTGDMWDYDTGTATASPWGKTVRTVNIGSGVANIGRYAFFECADLARVSVSDSVKDIRQGAFCRCAGLISINVPENLTSIGICAFSCCAGLESITIPDSVTSVGKGAFELCAAGFFLVVCRDSAAHRYAIDENITFRINGETTKNGACGDNLTWELDSDGNLTITGTGDMWDYDTGTATASPWGKAVRTVNIGSGVANIGRYAFFECVDLARVSVSDSVNDIRQGAFCRCAGLISINVPENLTSIGICAFSCCAGLESMTIPDSVTSVGKGAFELCAAGFFLVVCRDSAAHRYAIDENITFRINGETTKNGACGDNLTWELDSDGNLTITGTGEMWDYYNEFPSGMGKKRRGNPSRRALLSATE